MRRRIDVMSISSHPGAGSDTVMHRSAFSIVKLGAAGSDFPYGRSRMASLSSHTESRCGWESKKERLIEEGGQKRRAIGQSTALLRGDCYYQTYRLPLSTIQTVNHHPPHRPPHASLVFQPTISVDGHSVKHSIPWYSVI